MKIKHKLGIVFILLLISIFVLVSNLRSDNEQIEIGVIAPLTGPTAWWGEYVKQGIELAYEELPLDERENIKLIWEDDQCSSQKGFGALRKLIMIDKVKYVLGPLCNEVSIPTENIFDENKVVSLTTGLPDSKIANMGEYHFSYLPEIKFLMEELAKYSYYTSNNRRIAIISLNDAYGYENYLGFKEYFENYGGKVVAEEFFDKSDTDMKVQLSKIKASNPDSILLIAYGPSLINVLKQMEELGISGMDIYGINSFEAPSLLLEVPELAEGIVYPRPADKGASDSVRKFTELYEQKYGAENGVYTSNAYDSFKILINAIKKCGYDNQECVKKELSSVKDYAGANGLLSVDERGVGTYRGVMLKTVKNRGFVSIKND